METQLELITPSQIGKKDDGGNTKPRIRSGYDGTKSDQDDIRGYYDWSSTLVAKALRSRKIRPYCMMKTSNVMLDRIPGPKQRT